MKLSEAPVQVAGSGRAEPAGPMSDLLRPGGFSQVHIAALPSARCAFLMAALPASLVDGQRGPVPLRSHAFADDAPWDPEPGADAGELLLVLVDGPSSALLAMQSAAGEGELMSALVQWRESARRALRCAHRHPRYCVLVDVTVAPLNLEELFAGLGLSAPAAASLPRELPEPVRIDPVECILAESAAAAEPSNESLLDELRVSCRWPASALPPPPGPAQAAGALLRHRASMAERFELEARAAKADRLAQEGDLLARQIDQLEQAVRALHLKLAALEAEVPAQVRKAAGLEGQLRAHSASEQELRRTLVREVRVLKHEAQLRERAYRPGAAVPALNLRVEGLQLLDRVEAGDHRHLHFCIDTLVIGQRTLGGLQFRLLDHLGHPGFALFASEGEPPLAQWETHAHELDRPFMVLFPSEERGQRLLQRMGTSDWLLVCTLAQAVSIELASGQSTLRAGWRSVAARMGRQLTALPPRLRYDVASTSAPADGSAGSVDVRFDNAVFGASLLGDLRLRWWPSRRPEDHRLHVLAEDDGAEVPLSSWPVAPGGLLQPECAWPVGRDSSPVALATLPLHDRELLLAVLDALPGVAAQVQPQAAPAGLTSEAMADAAHQLNRMTRRVLRSWRIRQAAARIWHRGRRAA